MNSFRSQWIDLDESLPQQCGASAHGVAAAQEVDSESQRLYHSWIAGGRHGSMTYLEKYGDLRADPRLLLDGAQSIICFAFPYYYPEKQPAGALPVARYARGADYHEVVRERLDSVAASLREVYGGETRVCVDTAPLRERYWAARAGLGFIGLNNHLIIPRLGSYFFLGEILTTVAFRPAETLPTAGCLHCGRCIKACPTGALAPDGSCDASKCLSYLTIEHRGDFQPATDLHGSFYGCDRCAAACPHNSSPQISHIEQFRPDPRRMSLTRQQILEMTPETFAETFRHSPMKRAKLAGLQRNAASTHDK